MKFLVCQTIAILCILAVGALSTNIFHQTANASCDFYPIDECWNGQYICDVKTASAERVCPGSNDAQITACEERTEEAFIACALAAFVCYHAG